MYVLYSLTASGHGIATLVPSLFLLMMVVVACGSVMVLMMDTHLMSFHTIHCTLPHCAVLKSPLLISLFSPAMFLNSLGQFLLFGLVVAMQ